MRNLRLRWGAWRLLGRLRRATARGTHVVAIETTIRAPDGGTTIASVRSAAHGETARMIERLERFLREGDKGHA